MATTPIAAVVQWVWVVDQRGSQPETTDAKNTERGGAPT